MTPELWAGRTPRNCQSLAVHHALTAMHEGVRSPLLHLATGAGKSVIIGRLATLCRGPVLVSTPTQFLVDQLAETIEAQNPGEVGKAYQHSWDLSHRITVTCNPSLGRVLEQRNDWSCWIVDEAHRSEGPELRELQARVSRAVSVGLTATPFRSDARGLAMWDKLVYSYSSFEAVRDGVLVPWRVVRSDTEDDLDTVCEQWVREFDGPGIVSAVNVTDAEAFATRCGGLPIHGYLPRAIQIERIEMLRTGQVSALVHVQLLTEGFDAPWLRNLIIRRKTGSANRLVQEVGRIIRASEGKAFATIYDPLDAMGEVGLVHAAALEDAQARASREPEEWSIELLDLPDIPPASRTVAISRLAGWATDFVGELRGAGVLDPPTFGEGPWRQKKATTKQIEALRKMATSIKYLPTDQHRKAVEWLINEPKMRSGTASDLFSVLAALRKKRGCPVQPPELS